MINHFTFNGTSTAQLGLIVSGVSIFGAGSRKVEKAGIPGRNGDLQIELGGFNNYTVRYTVSITNDFSTTAQQIREWLLESKGYCELTDTYHPDEIRKACFNSDIEFTTTMLYKYGQASIQFDCLPQRYMIRNTPVKTGPNATTSTSPFLTTTPAPLRITLRGPATGTNTIKITNKNLLSNDMYVTSTQTYIGATGTGYSHHLPAGTYTITKSSNMSVGTYCRERNDASNTQIMSGHSGVKSATITLREGDYRFWFYSSGGVPKSAINYYQLERGSEATAFEEHKEQVFTVRLGDLTLTSSDSIIKSSGKWYVHNSTDTEITDADLIEDLNAIEKAVSYNGQTNILQSGFDITTISLNAEEVPSAYNGEPIIQANSTGYIVFNGEVLEVLSAPVTINCQTMQCYNGSVNMNNEVVISEFPTMVKGDNLVASDMELTITPNNWRH